VLTGKKQSITLTPWYRGFKGTIERLPSGQISFTGVLEKVNSTTLQVSELPIGIWEDDYKQFLFQLEDNGTIRSIKNDSSETEFSFELRVPRDVGYLPQEELLKKLRLVARGTENFTVWLPNGKLRCFATPEALCDYFIEFRLMKYEERRVAVLADLREQLIELTERLRFIRYYFASPDRLHKKTKDELTVLLTSGCTASRLIRWLSWRPTSLRSKVRSSSTKRPPQPSSTSMTSRAWSSSEPA
jgi:hypothetical protein